jgi:2-polyprenyl-3-methyl-5-hydroxy-6-metoxy-1,4-benzoquinol methylase
VDALKILVVIASYGRGNDNYLRRLIDEYRRMPWHCDIVVCSSVIKPVPDGVQLAVGLPTPDPWSLPFAHKKVMAERADRYDLFLYSEDDTLATRENIESFLRVSPLLGAGEIAGFLRYEQCSDGTIRYCDVNGHYHWDHTSVVQRGDYRFASFTNEHAAFYILTRSQLQRAIASGGFLVPPHHGKYDLACSAATDPYTQCGFRKLVCISHLREFLLHHLPDKYIHTRFGTPEIQFAMQLDTLLGQAADLAGIGSLVPVETRLRDAWYSKDYYEPARPELLEALPLSARTVLSIGCGSGDLERELTRRGARVCAVCLDPVIAACAGSASIETISGNMHQAWRRLADRTFDAILFANVLHLAPQPQSMLACFLKHLRPGGTCVVASPNLCSAGTLLNQWRRKPAYLPIGKYQLSGTHGLTAATMRNWLSSCSVDNIDVLYALPEDGIRRAISSFALGLLDPLIASDLIVTGRKRSGAPQPIAHTRAATIDASTTH